MDTSTQENPAPRGRVRRRGGATRRVATRAAARAASTQPREEVTAPRGRASRRRASTGRAQRGRRRTVEVDETARVRNLQQERIDSATDAISQLTEGEAKDLLKRVALRHPSLLLDVFDITDKDGTPEDPPPPGHQKPSWCSCCRCREMPTDLEKKCCGKTPEGCLAIKPEIETRVLDPTIINLILLMRGEYLAVPVERNNNAMRHGAYTAYTLMVYNRLGAGERRVIPSCVVWAIRDRYPEATGQYKGFVPARLA